MPSDETRALFLIGVEKMLSPDVRRTEAERRVAEGRLIVEDQRLYVAKRKAAHCDTTEDERLLSDFEQTLSFFEDELARLVRGTAL